MPNSNMESVEEQQSIRNTFADLHFMNYHEAYDEIKWEQALTKAEAALERREERLKVVAQIEFIKKATELPIGDIYGYLHDYHAALQQQLKTLDGQENTNGE